MMWALLAKLQLQILFAFVFEIGFYYVNLDACLIPKC